MQDDNISIRINGHPQSVPSGTTIAQLLARLEMNSRAIAVEVNQELQPRDRHADFVIKDEDVLEIVTLVGGG